MGNQTNALANATTGITAIAGIILVSPQKTIGYQPQLPGGNVATPVNNGPSFMFTYEGEQTLTLENDITDHFVENNTATNDQVAKKPILFSTHGFIGELTDAPPSFLQIAQTVARKLGSLAAYTPQLSVTAEIAYNEALFAYQVAQNAAQSVANAISSISGGGESVIGSDGITIQPNQTKQQKAFQTFYSYRQSNTLFTIQTPWAVFQNMLIKTMTVVQDADSEMITDFQITFKQFQPVIQQSILNGGMNTQGQLTAQSQAASPTTSGASTGTPTDVNPTSRALSLSGGGLQGV